MCRLVRLFSGFEQSSEGNGPQIWANRMTKKRVRAKKRSPAEMASGTLRIIGGRFRGRPIRYTGDPRTRPMKQRVREAAFNLIGPPVKGGHVIDLFAGTGALAWEAISRGAVGATLIERHFPTARLIKENAEFLGLTDNIEVVASDTFYWAKKLTPGTAEAISETPWIVFCSPPYELYVSSLDDMLALVNAMASLAPPKSMILVEADERFAMEALPPTVDWDVRRYPPAILALGKL